MPKKPAPASKTTEPTAPVAAPDTKQNTFVSMVQVSGGWVVVSIVVEGSRVVERTVHNDKPFLKEYASNLLKLVIAKKILHPSAPAVVGLD